MTVSNPCGRKERVPPTVTTPTVPEESSGRPARTAVTIHEADAEELRQRLVCK